jgi:hypothetical protein
VVGVGAVYEDISVLSLLPKLFRPSADENDHFLDMRLDFCEPIDGVSAEVDRHDDDELGMSGDV